MAAMVCHIDKQLQLLPPPTNIYFILIITFIIFDDILP